MTTNAKKSTTTNSLDEVSKEELLNLATAQIEKKFGAGSIMKLGDTSHALNVDVIPTGALSLDLALGIGGVPKGRIVEIYGPESSGKTTLALQILAQAQKQGGSVAFIDAEHALDPIYASKIGVDIDEVLISQPDTGEQGLEICDMLVRSNALDCIVIDSVAALVPRSEIEGEIGDTTIGLQARLMSQALRKLAGSLSKSHTTCIFINQLREKIGVMFGNPETTTGGRALKFFSSVRIDIRRIETIKDKGEAIGNRVRAKIVKNKCAAPFKQAEFDLMYGTGISLEGSVLDVACDFDIVQRAGAWYTYNDNRLGQGREAAKETLINHPELFKEIEKRTRVAAGLCNQGAASADSITQSSTSDSVSADSKTKTEHSKVSQVGAGQQTNSSSSKKA
ncbi:MAG: recombinase RecA [Coriobacteriales bacterium]|nr:recombinase RecA [Coriobacteriales bacterium]